MACSGVPEASGWTSGTIKYKAKLNANAHGQLVVQTLENPLKQRALQVSRHSFKRATWRLSCLSPRCKDHDHKC